MGARTIISLQGAACIVYLDTSHLGCAIILARNLHLLLFSKIRKGSAYIVATSALCPDPTGSCMSGMRVENDGMYRWLRGWAQALGPPQPQRWHGVRLRHVIAVLVQLT